MPQTRQQYITSQTRAHQRPDVPTEIQPRARDRHLRLVNPSRETNEGGREHDAGPEAAGKDEEGLPDVGVAAPEGDEEDVAEAGGEGSQEGEEFVGGCSVVGEYKG